MKKTRTILELSDYLKVHVKHKGEPLCRAPRGDGFRLCSKQEFANVPPDRRCRRCEQRMGGEYARRAALLGPQQRRCLRQIKRRAGAHGWCAVANLCENKTSAGWTSLYRSLRALVKLGLIKRRIDVRRRAYVKLSNGAYEVPIRTQFEE